MYFSTLAALDMSGRVKRKSLKVLEAEGREEFFPSAASALKRRPQAGSQEENYQAGRNGQIDFQ